MKNSKKYLEICRQNVYYKTSSSTNLVRNRRSEDKMSVQLLDKTRKINKLLHNSNSSKVVFNDICQVLMETLDSNILVLSKKKLKFQLALLIKKKLKNLIKNIEK